MMQVILEYFSQFSLVNLSSLFLLFGFIIILILFDCIKKYFKEILTKIENFEYKLFHETNSISIKLNSEIAEQRLQVCSF